MSQSHIKTNKTVIIVCFLAVAGLMFGLDTGVISGALQFIITEFHLEEQPQMQGWIVSALMFGAALGSVFAGGLSSKIGRKYSLVIASLIFVIGSVLSAAAPSVEILIASRGLICNV